MIFHAIVDFLCVSVCTCVSVYAQMYMCVRRACVLICAHVCGNQGTTPGVVPQVTFTCPLSRVYHRLES